MQLDYNKSLYSCQAYSQMAVACRQTCNKEPEINLFLLGHEQAIEKVANFGHTGQECIRLELRKIDAAIVVLTEF